MGAAVIAALAGMGRHTEKQTCRQAVNKARQTPGTNRTSIPEATHIFSSPVCAVWKTCGTIKPTSRMHAHRDSYAYSSPCHSLPSSSIPQAYHPPGSHHLIICESLFHTYAQKMRTAAVGTLGTKNTIKSIHQKYVFYHLPPFRQFFSKEVHFLQCRRGNCYSCKHAQTYVQKNRHADRLSTKPNRQTVRQTYRQPRENLDRNNNEKKDKKRQSKTCWVRGIEGPEQRAGNSKLNHAQRPAFCHAEYGGPETDSTTLPVAPTEPVEVHAAGLPSTG